MPVCTIGAGTEIWAVHPTAYVQPSFNATIERNGRGARFGPTARDPYGALHAGTTEDVAFAETLVRRRRRSVLSPKHLVGQSLSSIVVLRDLTIVDLRSGGALTTWGADTWLLHCPETDYPLTRQWPPWFRTCLPAAQGLCWTSRKNLVGDAYLFFEDRVRPADAYFARGYSIRLDCEPGKAMAESILRETFGIEVGVVRRH